MRTSKTLIRRGECPAWAETSLGARLILLWCGSIIKIKHYKWSKHLTFRISNVQIICIYNGFKPVQCCLIYLSGDMICIDNCLQPNPALFVCMVTCWKGYSQLSRGTGRGAGGGGYQWHVPPSRICHCKHRVKKKKTLHKYTATYTNG